MFELLSQTFNASLMAVTQLFLSAVVSTNPWFDQLDLQYHKLSQEIVCSTRLTESFTKTLDDVLMSGQSITLHFRFELIAASTAKLIQQVEVVNGLRYDSESEQFFLINSVDREVQRFHTIEDAKLSYISVRNLTIAATDTLDTDAEYYIRVLAFLDPIKLDNMGESVNLMLRWASVKPTIISDRFKLAPRTS